MSGILAFSKQRSERRDARAISMTSSRCARTRSASGWLAKATLGLVFVASGSVASADEAGESHNGEIDRWVPSAALEVGVFGHTGKGNINGSEIFGPREPNAGTSVSQGDNLGNNLFDPSASREDVVVALVGGTFELMSPRLVDRVGHPRVFLDVSIFEALQRDVAVGRDGAPGPMSFPDVTTPGAVVGENIIRGRGQQIKLRYAGPVIHAGFGTAFTVDLGEDRIRIKPSLVYSRMSLDVVAVANRAIRLTTESSPRSNIDDDFRLVQLAQTQTEVYHGAGPGLEIEYDTANRFGPFTVSIYLKGHASHLFGDLKTRLGEANPDPDPTTLGERVDWKYSQDRWVYRASTGIRFRWNPK